MLLLRQFSVLRQSERCGTLVWAALNISLLLSFFQFHSTAVLFCLIRCYSFQIFLLLWIYYYYFFFRFLCRLCILFRCSILLYLINVYIYEGCPESIQPFWISRESVAWHWCNLTVSQRRPYCLIMNSYSPVGLVIRQWDTVDWACVMCKSRIHKSPFFQRQF
jgi:hypothetical protein